MQEVNPEIPRDLWAKVWLAHVILQLRTTHSHSSGWVEQSCRSLLRSPGAAAPTQFLQMPWCLMVRSCSVGRATVRQNSLQVTWLSILPLICKVELQFGGCMIVPILQLLVLHVQPVDTFPCKFVDVSKHAIFSWQLFFSHFCYLFVSPLTVLDRTDLHFDSSSKAATRSTYTQSTLPDFSEFQNDS